MGFNWIDVVIIGIAGFSVLTGWESGLVHLLTGLVAFLGSLWLSVRFHTQAGQFLTEKFGIGQMWSTVVGYAAVAFGAQIVLSVTFGILAAKIPNKFLNSSFNRGLGAVVSVIKGLVITVFLLLVALALPLGGSVKQDINNSYLGSRLIKAAEKYGGDVKSSLSSDVNSLTSGFMTIGPQSKENLPLRLGLLTCQLIISDTSEQRMFMLINKERQNAGVKTLVWDEKIMEVARDHSTDMFDNKYFSHIDMKGEDAAQRMEAAGIKFGFAGENLAYAPDVDTAHAGLMKSEDHKKNILEPRFKKVGIGVVDGGGCEMMFTQNFTD